MKTFTRFIEAKMPEPTKETTVYKGYLIRVNPFNGLVWIEKDKQRISSAKDIADAKATIDMLTEDEDIEEDAPANCAGSGAVAGLGVGPKGEPGINLRKKRKDLDPLAEGLTPQELYRFKYSLKADDIIRVGKMRFKVENTRNNIPVFSKAGTSGSKWYQLEAYPDGTVGMFLSGGSYQRLGDDVTRGVPLKESLDESPAALRLAKAIDRMRTPIRCPGCGDIYERRIGESPFCPKCRPKIDDSLTEDACVTAIRTCDDIKEEADDKFAGADVFNVEMSKVMSARFGKHPRHRYSKYVGEDETGEKIRQHGRSTKSDIILRDEKTGLMTYLRRRSK